MTGDADPSAGDVAATPPPAATGRDDVLHWYDFVCPFCYLSQPANDELAAAGTRVVELAFPAHPEIPDGGMYVGPRHGAMYESIERTAAASGLPLRWPDRLPNTRLSLGAAEWIRLNFPDSADAFRRAAFAAHFAEGRDLGALDVVLSIGERCGVPPGRLGAGIASGEADRLLTRSENLGRREGVNGTPAWLHRGRLTVGLPSGGLALGLGLGPDD